MRKREVGTSLMTMLLFLQLGCSSRGFERQGLRDQLGVTKPTYDDNNIKQAFEKKANLPKPFKLAIYFKNSRTRFFGSGDWRWTDEDYKIVEAAGRDLQSEHLVSDVVPILNSVVTNEDLMSLRMAAAQHQADAILLVDGAADLDRYTNPLGWTYILLLPALFVPGSEVDVLFMSSASMWDVRNGFLYLTTESEAVTHHTYIAAFGKRDRDLFNEAKRDALSKLKEQVKRMIKGRP